MQFSKPVYDALVGLEVSGWNESERFAQTIETHMSTMGTF